MGMVVDDKQLYIYEIEREPVAFGSLHGIYLPMSLKRQLSYLHLYNDCNART